MPDLLERRYGPCQLVVTVISKVLETKTWERPDADRFERAEDRQHEK